MKTFWGNSCKYKYIRCLWGLVYVLLPSISQGTDIEKLQLLLAMEVFLKKPESRLYELHIHLTNTSHESITVKVRDLPWVPPNDSRWLSAVRMDDSHSPLEQLSMDGHFGSRNIRLLPGESIQDRFPLNPRFPSLLKDIDQFGVQFHWNCPPSSLKFQCAKGFPTTLIIPKQDPGQPDGYAIERQACLTLEQAIGLIKIDSNQNVLFLLTTEQVMSKLDRVRSVLQLVDDYVQQCQPGWTNSWAVSFFTEQKYAGFLREGENAQHFEQGLWQQANIGQYSSQMRTLFRFPWIRKRADTVYLSVYRSPEHREISQAAPHPN